MKLSLAWICDHIKDLNIQDIKQIDINSLIQKINITTAEVDGYKKIELDLSSFFIVKIKEIKNNKVIVENLENNNILELDKRENLDKDNLYLAKKNNNNYSWVILEDLGSEKEGLLQAIWLGQNIKEDIKNWKNKIETFDYILDIDNASITNRPDLWSHRGFAREIAAILDKSLISKDEILAKKEIDHFTIEAPAKETDGFYIDIDNIGGCDRFAGFYIKEIDNKPSDIYTALRLAKIDSRSINTLVDLTNYVMFDLGQPMHSFDANQIKNNIIEVRFAKPGESIELLDGATIDLIDSDLVIADLSGPIALAGIMGGVNSSINNKTTQVFLEAAHFNPTVIRSTASRIKKRTDASVRFEKNIDPNQNTDAILRYLKLLEKLDINYISNNKVASLGSKSTEKVINISQDFINNKIGLDIDPKDIIKILEKLGFKVQKDNLIFKVTVPSYRSKDITLKEDLLEEIARYIGLDNIPKILPDRKMEPFSTKDVMKTRAIKDHLAFGLSMNELNTYSFFDQEFLNKINWHPEKTVDIVNPVSENWHKLVTTLVPSLIKAIIVNKNKRNSLKFFEFARVWHMLKDKVKESKSLAGIIYKDKEEVDFYNAKAELNTLFDLLSIEISWEKSKELDLENSPWYHPYQTAHLVYDNKIIGKAGKSNDEFFAKNNLNNAFIFELDAEFLLNVEPEEKLFEPLQKYQEVDLDISMLVPINVTVSDLEDAIYSTDKDIISVELIDLFEKAEWQDKKSITMRFTIYNQEHTLAKEEIDHVWDLVVDKVQSLGAEVR